MFCKTQKDKVVEGVGAGEPIGSVSKKVNCPAKIFLKDVIKFPEFKVSLQHVFPLYVSFLTLLESTFIFKLSIVSIAVLYSIYFMLLLLS